MTKTKPRRCIAIDFDGTLFEEDWPNIGHPIWHVIHAAKKEQENGTELILNTLREGTFLEEAVRACERVGLHFDYINENADDWIAYYGSNPRKIAANEYWDDRSNIQVLIPPAELPECGPVNMAETIPFKGEIPAIAS